MREKYNLIYELQKSGEELRQVTNIRTSSTIDRHFTERALEQRSIILSINCIAELGIEVQGVMKPPNLLMKRNVQGSYDPCTFPIIFYDPSNIYIFWR